MANLHAPIPNKCDFCGMRVYYAHSGAGSTTQIDQQFSALHRLRAEGIIESVPSRHMTVGIGSPDPDTTSFCAINASAWNNKLTPCRYWSLQMQGAKLSDYLTIYHAKRNQEIATLLSVLGVCITIVIAIIQLSI